jgi:hypothetical protein
MGDGDSRTALAPGLARRRQGRPAALAGQVAADASQCCCCLGGASPGVLHSRSVYLRADGWSAEAKSSITVDYHLEQCRPGPCMHAKCGCFLGLHGGKLDHVLGADPRRLGVVASEHLKLRR